MKFKKGDFVTINKSFRRMKVIEITSQKTTKDNTSSTFYTCEWIGENGSLYKANFSEDSLTKIR